MMNRPASTRGGVRGRGPFPSDPLFVSEFPYTPGRVLYFRNQDTQALTVMTVGAMKRFGCGPGAFPVDIVKTDVDTYWQPGAAQNITLYLALDEDRRLRIASFVEYPFPGNSSPPVNTATPSGRPHTYVLAAPGFSVGQKYLAPNLFNNNGGVYSPCPGEIDNSGQPNTFYAQYNGLVNVTTPVYSGPAAAWRYAEGDLTPQPWDANGENNAEEWFFHNGIVQLINHHYHYAGYDWDNGWHVLGVTNPAVDLAGMNWVTGHCPSGLTVVPLPHQILKLERFTP